ncbi:MAG TPA: DUF2851 family protein [Sphingobacteriaceae bacterium]|nr:DUF2851 family protein [Sphingobacteriaceae bacterium]
MHFGEDFLHYLWKHRLIKSNDLYTSCGQPINIISVGIHNLDAGPDFENSKIKIADTLWAGNVEIHINSSDWEKHNHQYDDAYENVILHVVYKHDKELKRKDGTVMPVLELLNLIPEEVLTKYRSLSENLNWIPCEKHLPRIDAFHIHSWLSRVLVERLEEKCQTVNKVLIEYKQSWDDAFYIMLARNFGFKINSLPFEMLARSLPQQILARHKGNSLQIEALIFGQAGFLSQEFIDEYPQQLQKEYMFLKTKYSLQPVDRFLWKFLRMRPQNFPTLRLAQFSALIVKSNHLFSRVIDIHSVPEIKEFFQNLPVNKYWETHFRFDVTSRVSSAQIGDQSIKNILINTVSLFLFAYGKNMNVPLNVNRAMELLELVPAEENNITNKYKDNGIKMSGAFTSQAVLQLKKSYCDKKKCLHCGIGTRLLNN